MNSTSMNQALSILKELEGDEDTPKNVKIRICQICANLQNIKTQIDISKALNEIEALSENYNIPSHTRTQLFSVVSLLEIV